ncbi:MAG: hypothetical protein ACE5EA_00475 [Nitrospirota bacterium]
MRGSYKKVLKKGDKYIITSFKARGLLLNKDKRMPFSALIFFLFLFILFIHSVFYNGLIFAADTFTVNNSNQIGAQGSAIVNAYVPFLSSECSGGSCGSHGGEALSSWLNNTFFDSPNKFVPSFDSTPASGYSMNTLFGVGQGLPSAWLNVLNTTPYAPLTVPDNPKRTEWVDQIVIKYTSSGNFAQNFRSQLTFGDSIDFSNGNIYRSSTCAANVAQCKTIVDQRIEQGDQDMEGTAGSKDIRQVFQQAFAATSGPNTTSDPLINEGAVVRFGQNIEQNVEGFFYSCLNCNLNNEHAFSVPEKLLFQNWPVVPTITSIIHGSASTQAKLN